MLLCGIGVVILVWGLVLFGNAGWAVNGGNFGLVVVIAAGSLQTLSTGLFAWIGHKKTWFLKCYHVLMLVLVVLNIVVIVVCLDPNYRKALVDSVTTQDQAVGLKDNLAVIGYVMCITIALEILSLSFSVCRRYNLLKQNKYSTVSVDEDDLGGYIPPRMMEMGQGSDSMNSPAVAMTSERRESFVQSDVGQHGWLYKKGELHNTWRRRWFVLRSDRLEYYDSPESPKANGFIMLQGMEVNRAKPKWRKQNPWTFKISTKEGKKLFGLVKQRRYLLYARTAEKERIWIQRIRESIKTANLGPPVGEEDVQEPENDLVEGATSVGEEFGSNYGADDQSVAKNSDSEEQPQSAETEPVVPSPPGGNPFSEGQGGGSDAESSASDSSSDIPQKHNSFFAKYT